MIRVCSRLGSCQHYFKSFTRRLYCLSWSPGTTMLFSPKKIKCQNDIYLTNRITVRTVTTDTMRGNSRRNITIVVYTVAAITGVAGLSYAAVPLYRLYCQTSGLGGTVKSNTSAKKMEEMRPVRDRVLTIRFNADKSANMRWSFKPLQSEVKVVPGETALAFYSAKNPTDKPISGISTYNVVPFDAGQYFNKVQCFCFEEQMLNPHEEVEMPVFFYIDPDFDEDPSMENVNTITLSYTFFEVTEGHSYALPIRS
ncbi:cytochrome c oxidase assembly protein COX11, mitochondrial-like [Corticium candelabrum]|uniref:cytochrome c oxidase assembly protein COX11, mitochondrial-like n=1 Tax=Corticium candelabrum TaxID=121492 RepID=UPI002E31DAC7|nr:cytochrome c oxidase assembly protein COX11, mitochondrial-like [Corticium candelabrum]